MDKLDDVGKIFFSFNRVHWIIPNFHKMPQKVYTVIGSPRFWFKDRYWKMFIYPNGSQFDSSAGWFGINVLDESFSFDSREELNIRLGITGQIQESVMSSRAESEGDGNYHLLRLVRHSVLESNKEHMILRGNLQIFFSIEEDTADLPVNSTTEEQMEKSKESENTSLNTSMEIYSQLEADTGLKKLQSDLKEFFISGNISDVTVKVRDQEFKVHRSILGARSPVLLAMMMHETKEKTTGIVNIEDADPNTFSNFLYYLYTGNLENLTAENVPNLYITADKYEIIDLKDACLKYMVGNISVENFCDILSLSIRHDEKELSDLCINFFVENSLEIVMTSKWQQFLMENPIIGNELYIKQLKITRETS